MRTSGILLHITSLSSEYGIGTLGKEAFRFVDFLKKSGQSYWQILPVGPTGYGDSPYQSFSAFAGNPYLIDLDLLADMGLLSKSEYKDLDFKDNDNYVNFYKIYKTKPSLLSLAASRLKEDADYKAFLEENKFWLFDYALYTAIKSSLSGIAFFEWPDKYRNKDHFAIEKAKSDFADEISVICKIQYLFMLQWKALKRYANENGIGIIGDMPIYVAQDSADVFSKPEIFALDENKRPIEVAGCPPDAFSKTGQLWGNPLYDWKALENQGFEWWGKRIEHCGKLFDKVRIDHFRGFEAYYCVPYGSENAMVGVWRKGPCMKLFKALKNYQDSLEIIAEDLGVITDGVRKLLKSTGFPGMKVLQFAFDPDSDSEYLPHNHIKNCVIYTGTHDNDTTLGWLSKLDKHESEFTDDYMRLNENEGKVWGVIRTAMESAADLCIIPMQDYINAGSEARMNTPSTLGTNWTWRLSEGCINDWLAKIIYKCTKTYRRIPTA